MPSKHLERGAGQVWPRAAAHDHARALERGLLAHVRQSTLVMRLKSLMPSSLAACIANGRLRHTGEGAVKRAPQRVVSRV